MKKSLRILSTLLALLMPIALLNGCSVQTGQPDETAERESVALYSKGIDDNGFWKGIRAKDYVSDFGYMGLTIPKEVHTVSDEDVQGTVDTLMEGYISRVEITDRAVAAGDTVNIDYDGKVDGEVFDGGSTMEVGVDVVVATADEIVEEGQTMGFLDGFLAQLIGHMPGETVNIAVTFPDDYYDETMCGKEAVFETTIHYILERDELTDEFVKEKMSASNGWTTVAEMKEGIRAGIREDRIEEYVMNYLLDEVPVKSIPDQVLQYQQDLLVNSYQEYADYLGITLEQYLQEYESGASVEEFLANSQEDLKSQATYCLVAQAVAEDAGITVTDADMQAYSAKHLWSSDLSVQIECYGMPYVKQAVLYQMVLDLITDNAVLA